MMEGRERDGANARFEAAFESHYADVLAFALRRVDGRAAAEDVASDTFAVAWRRRKKIPDPALPWLYGVARRVIANQRRSGRRRARLGQRLESEFETGSGRDPAETAGGRESVLSAFDRLPDLSREVLRLIAWEELDSKSAARALGCTSAAFRVRLHRARRQLERELDAEAQTFDVKPSPANGPNAEEAR